MKRKKSEQRSCIDQEGAIDSYHNDEQRTITKENVDVYYVYLIL